MLKYIETDKDPAVQYLANLHMAINSLLYLTYMCDEENKELLDIYGKYGKDIQNATKVLKDFRKKYTETFGDF